MPYNSKVEDPRRVLVERVASSPHLLRSARLRDLLLYISDRVINEDVKEIHEQEVGHRVFGRPADYDTAADNIARVHASQLRKRLEQYFASAGVSEPLVIEIPKGNYAPLFRQRTEVTETAEADSPRKKDWRLWTLAALVLLLACSTAFLLVRTQSGRAAASGKGETVRLLWSRIFRPGQPADVVADDAAVALYQEITGRTVTLSEYFDRSYLRLLPEAAAAAKLDPDAASAIALHRHSSYATTNMVARLYDIAGVEPRQIAVQFARDYSFRALKTNSAVLIGNNRSNPWIEPFESKIGIRWIYDKHFGVYYPEDTWAGASEQNRFHPTETGEAREGYCSIALVPNLGGSGNVLIVSATGGSAMGACGNWLGDEEALAKFRKALPAGDSFPYFEALLHLKGRGTLPRQVEVVICRPPRA